MTIEEYLSDPCGKSPLPYYKYKRFKPGLTLRVYHERDYSGQGKSQAFFRCIHNLKNIGSYALKDGYSLSVMAMDTLEEKEALSAFVSKCYRQERLPVHQIQGMVESDHYEPSVWLKIQDAENKIVATAVSEKDTQAREGCLEWIQVLPSHQGLGLGKVLVVASLLAFEGSVDFVTVSGRLDNMTNPHRLYKKCGFTGQDVWHFVEETS